MRVDLYPVVVMLQAFFVTGAMAEPDVFGLGTGRDGALAVTEKAVVINHYAQVTGPIASGDTLLFVATTEGFGAGDLLMVLQTTGFVPDPRQGDPGLIDLTHDPVGRWELARVEAVEQGKMRLKEPLLHSYAGSVTQVIRVPEYTQVTIGGGASLVAAPWNGSTGGVLAFLARGIIRNDGWIDASGTGFRGGIPFEEGSHSANCSELPLAVRSGARMGEGIAILSYGPLETGRDNATHGGGGGDCQASGGGGGGNGGLGEQGEDATIPWDGTKGIGGLGGARLVYSMLDHLTLGGGGGGSLEARAGTGGGIIFIRGNQLIGSGSILAEGEQGTVAPRGGGGGGGAGGTVSLRIAGPAECGSLSVRGGGGGKGASGPWEDAGSGGRGGSGRVLYQAAYTTTTCPILAEGGPVERLWGNFTVPPISIVGGDVPPASPVIGSPQNGEVIITSTPTFKGTTDSGTKVEIFVLREGTLISREDVSVDSSGNWKYFHAKHLLNGSYTLEATAKMGTVPSLTSEISFVVNRTPPDTRIEEPKPPPHSRSMDAVFRFSEVNLRVASYECKLDGEQYADCNSPKTYSDLSPGLHTFSVRAKDDAGNVDPSPAGYTWIVDLEAPPPPEVKIPLDESYINTSTLKVTGTAEALSQVFVLIDGKRWGPTERVKGTWELSINISSLQDKKYTLNAEAIDEAGNVSAPSSARQFTLDRMPPDIRIEKAPEPIDNSRTATFQFASNSEVDRYECRIDGGEFNVCGSAMSISELSDGDHTLSVRAVDKAGNRSLPVTCKWTVDTISPSAQVQTPENNGWARVPKPIFEGNGEPRAIVKVFIDGKPAGEGVVSQDGHWRVESRLYLNDDDYRVSVEATDQAGNTSERTSPTVFYVDTVPPNTEILSAPLPYSKSEFAVFLLRSDDGKDAKFECGLDGAEYVECLATASYDLKESGHVDGKHILLVRAKDRAGNVDLSPLSHTWTVITEPPPPPEIDEPTDGATVSTLRPTISGSTVPKGEVAISLDGKPVGVAKADERNKWNFQLPEGMVAGTYKLSCKATDAAGNSGNPAEVTFSLVAPKGEAHAIGGGLGCGSTGTSPELVLLAMIIGSLLRVRKSRQ